MRRILVFCVAIALSCFAFSASCSAWSGSRYNSCINSSGGRGDIDSVRWACEHATDSVNACSLWIGSSTSASVVVSSYNPSGDNIVNVQFWGMCTSSPNMAGNITTDNDNNSITNPGPFIRGTWASPTYTTASLNVDMFIAGLTPTIDAGGNFVYSKTIDVGRCHNANGTSLPFVSNNSCSHQGVPVGVVVNKQDYTQSYVSVQKFGSDVVDQISTGRPSNSGTAQLSNNEQPGYISNQAGVTDTYMVGDKVTVTFAHSVFSSSETNNAGYTISRARYGVDSSPSISSGSSSETVNLNNKSSQTYNLYTNSGYPTTQTFERSYLVELNNVGLFSVCENVTFGSSGTGACVELNVLPLAINEYRADSNVAIRESSVISGDYESTGITVSDMDRVRAVVDITAGEERNIVFSHNAYSEMRAYNETWGLDRDSGANRLSANGAGYTITDRRYCGAGGNINFLSGEGYLVGEPRNCHDDENVVGDGLGHGLYLARDIYRIRFNTVGTYDFCETFSVGGINKTRVCARVVVRPTISGDCGAWTPSKYLSSNEWAGYTLTVSKVKNNSVSAYNDWDDTVFAKPGDKIDWIHCYYPGAQKVADTKATPNNYDPAHNMSLSNGSIVGLNNHLMKQYGDWTNEYKITTSDNFRTRKVTTASGITETFGDGDSSVKTFEDFYNNSGGYEVANTLTAETLTEKIESGKPAVAKVTDSGLHTWRCNPVDCSYDITVSDGHGGTTTVHVPRTCYTGICKHDDNFFTNNVSSWGTTSSHADVKIPYNFENTASIELSNSTNIVYAGETARVSSVDVQVGMRNNTTLNGTYATRVDDAQIKVIGYVSDSSNGGTIPAGGRVSNTGGNICSVSGLSHDGHCDELDFDARDLNSGGSVNGGTDSIGSLQHGRYNVYDVNIGKYFCVVAAVYPYTVANDTVMSTSGYRDWYVSEPSCKQIAKKPIFQVLGGGVYSAGNIRTIAGVKNHLSGIYGYEPIDRNHVTAFNSWAEQGVVSKGTVSNFASGAATGLNQWYYGSYEGVSPSYCNDRVPLSFANYPCATTTGNLGSNSVSSTLNVGNRRSLVDYWTSKIPGGLESIVDDRATISDGRHYRVVGGAVDVGTGTILRYTYKNGNLDLDSAVIPNQVTHIVKADGDINVKGDIGYDKSVGMALSSYIPKLIIYAGGNIGIDCEVESIDAILIAEGKVDTCANFSASSEDKQLTINGVVIADQVEFNRVYGAGVGANSGVPAEIINYDISALLWGRYVAGSSQSNKLTMTYQHELAPRL
ncbi:hypothetical protein IKF02_03290 [Candidatus Saccharibacteria bacterium]|nr:hypothetical protein [Candidatus Saccharibacteria bacterium]